MDDRDHLHQPVGAEIVGNMIVQVTKPSPKLNFTCIIRQRLGCCLRILRPPPTASIVSFLCQRVVGAGRGPRHSYNLDTGGTVLLLLLLPPFC